LEEQILLDLKRDFTVFIDKVSDLSMWG
jgi:hypothetical protein